ncbi:PAS domain S-box-containing protein [Pseudoduganella lurida]|uniref:histidine kinase n=1 Tax=Pseudoduganella lurida TaxID=1036180 RepID=A0A562RJQ2_9BURK|nr:histidine kinase famiy protein [Pseudoduganella lurida]TWI69268.1 PAS domain S-box-containing protein [Pseudoduganella lurida]
MVSAFPRDDDDEIVLANGSVGVKAGSELEGSAYNPMGNPGVEHWKASSISQSGFAAQDNIFFAAVEMTRMPMVVTDPRQPDNPIVFTNGAFLDLTGYSPDEVLGRNCRFLQGRDTDRATVEEVRTALAQHKAVAVDLLNYRKDGSSFWNGLFIGPVFDKDGALLYFFASQLDITTRRVNEITLTQAQKMEAIGQLTAGLAHDFNNLLQVAIGNQEIALRSLANPDLTGKMLAKSQAALQKATKLTQQLLAFARKQRLEPRLVNLNNQIMAFSEILASTLGEQVELRLDLRPGLPECSLDPHQFEVAVLNALLNARDAMPTGGTITIGTSVLRDKEKIGAHRLLGDQYVVVCVSDTGQGMSRDVMARATEPFFTTKGPGTGLGLAMVHGFVEQSHGRLELDSELGKGTQVRMIFPVADQAQGGPNEQDGAQAVRDGRAEDVAAKRVLVVDDNADVREMAAAFLSSLGYETVEAESGEAALVVLEATTVDLVFSDVIMPGGMNGLQLIDTVRRRYPGVATLAATGYAENALERPASAPDLQILPKPFKLHDLADMVSKLTQ